MVECNGNVGKDGLENLGKSSPGIAGFYENGSLLHSTRKDGLLLELSS